MGATLKVGMGISARLLEALEETFLSFAPSSCSTPSESPFCGMVISQVL